MATVFVLLLGFVLNTALPYYVVSFDLARLSEEQLARAWPSSSFLSAVFLFGAFALPVHFTKTRRSLLGFGFGLVACAGTLAAEAVISGLVSTMLGVDR